MERLRSIPVRASAYLTLGAISLLLGRQAGEWWHQESVEEAQRLWDSAAEFVITDSPETPYQDALVTKAAHEYADFQLAVNNSSLTGEPVNDMLDHNQEAAFLNPDYERYNDALNDVAAELGLQEEDISYSPTENPELISANTPDGFQLELDKDILGLYYFENMNRVLDDQGDRELAVALMASVLLVSAAVAIESRVRGIVTVEE